MDPATRLLRLLSLFQSRPRWSGPELAERLGVTERTVRRDVARLREAGYPVDAAAGPDGGYALGVGGRLPPLLLDDDEAVAVTLGLRVATATSLAGMESTAVAALAKIESVMPARLSERVRDLTHGLVQMPGPEVAQVDPGVLAALAGACRRIEGLRFEYVTHGGLRQGRSVEPLQVVHTGRRWYLVARNRDRRDWRTFRVDRISDPVLTGHRYTFDNPPDPEALVAQATNVAPWLIEARLRIDLPPKIARRRYPPTVAVVEPDPDGDPKKSLLRIGANEQEALISFAMALPPPVEVLAPAGLRDAVVARANALLTANAAD